VAAISAMGAWLDNAFSLGPAAQAHVQEAAEGQTQKPGKYRS
jgi:hypothetical protein